MNKYALIIDYGKHIVELSGSDILSVITQAENVMKNENNKDWPVGIICEKTGTVTTSENGTQSQMYNAILCTRDGKNWHCHDKAHGEHAFTVELSKHKGGTIWISAC